MALVRTLTVSTTTFERTKEKFHGFRQTEYKHRVIKLHFEKTFVNITDPSGAQFDFVFISTFDFSSERWSKQAALEDWPYVRIPVAWVEGNTTVYLRVRNKGQVHSNPDTEKRPGKVKRSSASDWSIFHQRPERDYLFKRQLRPLNITVKSFEVG